MSGAGTRLAVVGGGPRAAYALESLARQARAGGVVPQRIDVYEPRAVLGRGPAYEGDQPDWIRLNIPQQAVDAGEVLGVGGALRSPLIGGLPVCPSEDGLPGEDLYPPRSRAGDYLVQVASTSIRALLPSVVTHRRHEVGSVRRSGDGLAVAYAGGVATYDAVLLATGHARAWRGRLPATSGGVICLPALPVGSLTAYAATRRPSRVHVRGASLTAIDAVLALTEGTGGRFVGAGGREAVGYRPGDPDVHVTLVSRTGRLMDVKPESHVLRRHGVTEAIGPALTAFAEHGDVAELLLGAATLVLQATSRAWSPAPVAVHARQVRRALDGLGGAAAPEPRERLATSLAQARGLAAPDAAWALGQAWRSAYPWLVRRQRQLSTRPIEAPLDWPDYDRLRPELERLAFGPPPVNAQKLLALMDAGRLDVVASHSTGFDDLTAGTDLVVDAVSAPPGVRDVDDPLWTQLLADGLVTVAPYGRGILVDPAAGCLRPDGTLVPGLSAVGRMTEDVVLGNDTLSRTMHDDLEHWARRLCTAPELVA